MYHAVLFSRLGDIALMNTDKNLCPRGAYIVIGIKKKTEALKGLMVTCL